MCLHLCQDAPGFICSAVWLQTVREVEADILLEELTKLMSRVAGRSFSAAEAKQWTMEMWVTTHFQVWACCFLLFHAVYVVFA